MTDPEAQAQHPSGGLPDMKPRSCMILSLAIALILVALTGYSAPPASVEQVPRLTKEAVKEMIGKPDVVIVDIRYIKQYEQSDSRLPGAVFVQPENFDEFAKNFPKQRTYVLY
jgi:Rhodanese-like domain